MQYHLHINFPFPNFPMVPPYPFFSLSFCYKLICVEWQFQVMDVDLRDIWGVPPALRLAVRHGSFTDIGWC